ncbi:MAG: hypothetical protein ABIC68_05960 [Candidatus Omnitrophota bacterium]
MKDEKIKFKKEYEIQYNKLLEELGPANFRVFDPDDFPLGTANASALHICVSTSASGIINIQRVSYKGLELLLDSPIIVQRDERFCQHDGSPHFNSDDQVFFVTKNGDVGRIHRKDSPDHYIAISTYGGLQHIAQAYHLPKEKFGPIRNYIENGALMPIRIDCSDNKEAKIVDITKRKQKSEEG